MLPSDQQMLLPMPDPPLIFHKAAGTFANNHTQSIHRWFPYIEGYSFDLVSGILDNLPRHPSFIYDPFGGSGTTMLVASEHNIASGYSEINPFMRFVTECKVNIVQRLATDVRLLAQVVETLEVFADSIISPAFDAECTSVDISFFTTAFHTRGYFDDHTLRQILAAKARVDQYEGPARDFLLLGLAAVLVQVSNLIRRADLRYRRPNEMHERDADLRPVLAAKVRGLAADLRSREGMRLATTIQNGADARVCTDDFYSRADVVITSPPYLNGTNYFRNTKLELWLCGFLRSESDLKDFTTAAVTAGINNVSSRNRPVQAFPEVERYAIQLDEVAYDDRIPKLVRAYFSDMHQVFLALHDTLRAEGKLYLDIGDSMFAGVHIPTHDLLAKVANAAGFNLDHQHVLRKRHSNNGAPLTQVLLEFSKPSTNK